MKKTAVLAVLLLLAFAALACGGQNEGLILTTGDETGTYYSFGNLLARKVNSATTTFVAVVASEGSKDNILSLARDEAQLAFAQCDAMIAARNGTDSFRVNGPNKSFSVVAALYPEAVHIVTLDPEIASVADLRGKRVSVGPAGSGGYLNAVDILGAYGMTEKDIISYNYTISDSADALLDGWLDAIFITVGAPVTAVTAMAQEKPVYLVSLDEEHIRAVTAGKECYGSAVIGADVYGTPEDCVTVAVTALLIADNDVPADEVYDFVRGVYDNVESLESESRFADYLSLPLAASFSGIPYHPGAARYYSERGISVPTA